MAKPGPWLAAATPGRSRFNGVATATDPLDRLLYCTYRRSVGIVKGLKGWARGGPEGLGLPSAGKGLKGWARGGLRVRRVGLALNSN